MLLMPMTQSALSCLQQHCPVLAANPYSVPQAFTLSASIIQSNFRVLIEILPQLVISRRSPSNNLYLFSSYGTRLN
jgi:hypothetical protein